MSEQIDNALLEAHRYVSRLSLCYEHGISPDSKEVMEALCLAYQRLVCQRKKMCLFTGAGVSFTGAESYQTPGWWDLLLEIYGEILPGLKHKELRESFEEFKKKNYDRAWKVATELEEMIGKEKFIRTLSEALIGRTTAGDKKYKRLPKAYLDHATTLNAVIAFCSRIRAIQRHPCFEPNPNIQAILTLNYDCFLESGATRKYQKDSFKPMGGKGWGDDSSRVPVYHIHGYIWYSKLLFTVYGLEFLRDLERRDLSESLRQEFRQHKIQLSSDITIKTLEAGSRWKVIDNGKRRSYMILREDDVLNIQRPDRELIITEASYETAYSNPESFTRETLDKSLSEFSTLFIGVSFEDELLLERLEALAKQPGTPTHFALMQQDTPTSLVNRLRRRCGVKPILYYCHKQIPTILGRLYKAGLQPEPGVRVESEFGVEDERISQDDYWELLLLNKK